MSQRAYSAGTNIFIYAKVYLQPQNVNGHGLPRVHEEVSSLPLAPSPPGTAVLPRHAFPEREAGLRAPSQRWPCSCPPKHHDKASLSLTSPCFSFASLTKTSSPALQACCASLTFQAHTLTFQERSKVAVCQITSRHSCIYNGRRTCLSQPTTAAIVHSRRRAAQLLHSFR